MHWELKKGSCAECIRHHVGLYEARVNSKARKRREPLVSLLVKGEPVDDVPRAAFPDCHTCPKPELDESNAETLHLWELVGDQQTYNDFSGERLGLRMEAVVAALDELCRQGHILDRARAFHRIWIVDAEVRRATNAKIRMEMEKARTGGKRPPAS